MLPAVFVYIEVKDYVPDTYAGKQPNSDISIWGHPYFCGLGGGKLDQTKAEDTSLRIPFYFCM